MEVQELIITVRPGMTDHLRTNNIISANFILCKMFFTNKTVLKFGYNLYSNSDFEYF